MTGWLSSPAFLPATSASSSVLLADVPLERVVVVERLLVHLNELLDRRLVLGGRPPGEHRLQRAKAIANEVGPSRERIIFAVCLVIAG